MIQNIVSNIFEIKYLKSVPNTVFGILSKSGNIKQTDRISGAATWCDV